MQIPGRGQRFVLAVRPLDWYAGSVGSGALVEEVSETAVYVVFDGGLRESFPPARFAEYFKPEEHAPVATKTASNSTNGAARTASGRMLLR
ncbi:MAG: hypothetical protein ABJA82_10630 [Myxococcales bacterium]